MRLSELAVRRPVTTAMFIAATVLAGVMAATGLGLDLYPELNLPYVTVATVYPNADPQTVEAEVTHLVEGVLATARGLRRIDSLSMENVSLVFAEFGWGTPIEETIAEIRARLGVLALTFPSGVQTPVVLRLDPNQFPTLLIGVSGSGDLLTVTDLALEVVQPRLERVPGVAQVAVLGGVEREIQVLYDSAKLREHGLTPAHLQQFLQLQNATVPAGVVEHNGVRYQTRVGNHFTSVQQIRDLVIGENRLPVEGLAALWPPLLQVKDVAQVVEGVKPPTGYARMDGRPTVLLQVFKSSGANTVAVADGVRAALAELKSILPDADLTVIIDQSTAIRRSLESLVVFGLMGAAAVVLVLFLFLRTWRGMIVVALAIPLSVLLTLAALYLLRMNLNLMTLGGLALATGMVVDNAIIVLENIFRRRSQGEDPVSASIAGGQEMTAAIAAATLTTVAVFLPAALLDTFAGQLFKELGITVSLALGASLLIALTVVPSLAARLLRSSLPAAGAAWDSGAIARTYGRLLERILRRPGPLLGFVAVLSLVTVGIVPLLDTEFLPKGYRRSIYITMETPPGTTLAETDAVARMAEERLKALHDIQHVATQVGEQRQEDVISLLGDYGPNTIQLIAFLRSPTSPERLPAVMAQIRETLADLPVARLAVSDEWNSTTSVFSSAIVLQLSGRDVGTLQQLAADIRQRLQTHPAVGDVHIPYAAPQPELFLAVNQSRALIGGLTTAQISLAVRNALTGVEVTQVRENGRTIPVVLRPQPTETADLSRLLDYPVTSPVVVSMTESSAVRLANVVSVEEGTAPQAIRRIDGMRALEVQVRSAGGDLGATLAAVDEAIASLELPPGYEIRTAGIRQLINDSLSDLTRVLLWSLVLVYVVMAAQLETWRHPLIIMVTVPLAGSGAIWALWITGQKLGVASLVGLIMVGGIAVNNGIVLVDRFLQLRRQGADVHAAVVDAATSRLRPVLMTAVTTIAGMLPMAVTRGEGTEFQVPLAVAVIGGLLTATVLTLFVVPALCLLSEGRRARGRRNSAGAAAAVSLLVAISFLFGAPHVRAQAPTSGLRWIAGVGYDIRSQAPLYLLGAGLETRRGDWRWKLELQAAADAGGDPRLVSLDAGAEWFQPVSFFGYYELNGRLTLRTDGRGGPIRSAVALRSEGVLGNLTGMLLLDAVPPDFPVLPWDPPRLVELAAGGHGRWHVKAELREQHNRELNLLRELQWSRKRWPEGDPGAAVLAGGAEVRAGSGWLLGKMGIRWSGNCWQPVFGAGYRFRPSPYSQLAIAAVTATAFTDRPGLSVSYQLLTDAQALVGGLDVAFSDGRLLPALFLHGEPHSGGWRWQLRLGSPQAEPPLALGVTIAF